tara:strand:- start:173 stop:289 length:117 start_codon:yes stop_codon:yes gene_type:complete
MVLSARYTPMYLLLQTTSCLIAGINKSKKQLVKYDAKG